MKRTTSAFLAIAMLMAFLPLLTSAALPETNAGTISGSRSLRSATESLLMLLSNSSTNFTDLSETHWANKDIMALVEMGALNGYPDGSFRPERNLTKGEMAKVISEVFGVKNPTEWTFPDFDPEHEENYDGTDERNVWYAPYATDIYMYYSSGHDGPGYFYGASPANRRDVVNILINVLYKKYADGEWTFEYSVPDDYMDYLEETFTDIAKHLAGEYVGDDFWWSPYESYSHWYIASKLGIITGYPDGSFRHHGNITRAEFCTMVNRALALHG